MCLEGWYYKSKHYHENSHAFSVLQLLRIGKRTWKKKKRREMVMVGILLARLRTRVDQTCFEEVLTLLLIGCVLWEIDLTSQTLASSSMKWEW